jgi:hypothetical protein
MNTEPNVFYTAHIRTTGGRDGGRSVSNDGRLDIRHSPPGSPLPVSQTRRSRQSPSMSIPSK